MMIEFAFIVAVIMVMPALSAARNDTAPSPHIRLASGISTGVTISGPGSVPIVQAALDAQVPLQFPPPPSPPPPPLPTSLPALPSALLNAVNLLRSILDATTFTLCSTTSATVAPTCTNHPLSIPVSLDVDHNGTVDAVVQFGPTIVLSNLTGLSAKFSIDPPLLSAATPVHAAIWAVWDVPVANIRATIGFSSLRQAGVALPSHSAMTVTVASVPDAVAGRPTLDFSITHSSPGSMVDVLAGMAPIVRAANGTVSTPDVTAADLNFTPVPTSTTGVLSVDVSNASNGQAAYKASIKPNVATKLEFGLAHRAPDPSSSTPCCPLSTFDALADHLPAATTTINIATDSHVGSTAVGYQSTTTLSHLRVSSSTFDQTAGLTPTAAEAGTASSFVADATNIPTNVTLDETTPPTTPTSKSFDISYRGTAGSAATAPLVTVPTVDLSVQRRISSIVTSSLIAHAEQIPGSMHVNGQFAGDALSTPAGPNLDGTVTYDAHSSAQNLVVDDYDAGKNHPVSLHGTVGAVPPWMQLVVGTHPNQNHVSFDARTSASAAPGSSSLGPIHVQYASDTAYLNAADTTQFPTPTGDYAFVVQRAGADGQVGTDDDTMALDATLASLQQANVTTSDDGVPNGNMNIAGSLYHGAARPLDVLLDSDASHLVASLSAFPHAVAFSYQRTVVGTAPVCGSLIFHKNVNEDHVTYSVPNPTITDAIQHLHVHVDAKSNGLLDPNNAVDVVAGVDPTTGQGPLPSSIVADVNELTKEIVYNASSSIGQVHLQLASQSVCPGKTSSVHLDADLRGVPAAFDASWDQHQVFLRGGRLTIGEDLPLATPLGSISLRFSNSPQSPPVYPSGPASGPTLIVESDSGTGAVGLNIALSAITLLRLDMTQPTSSETDVSGHLNILNNPVVYTALTFDSPPATSPSCDGSIPTDPNPQSSTVLGNLTLPSGIGLTLKLPKCDPRISYTVSGTGNLGVDAQISSGDESAVHTLPPLTPNPIGLRVFNSLTADPGPQDCTLVPAPDGCAQTFSAARIYLPNAPRTLDLFPSRLSSHSPLSSTTAAAATFTGYHPPVSDTSLTVDIQTLAGPPASRMSVHALLKNIPDSTAGYGLKLYPISSGPITAQGQPPTTSFFNFQEVATNSAGPLQLDAFVGASPSPPTAPAGPAPLGAGACTRCNLVVHITMSKLPPGLSFAQSTNPQTNDLTKQEMNINASALTASGAIDTTDGLGDIVATIQTWQLLNGTPRAANQPQWTFNLTTVPSTIAITLDDGVQGNASTTNNCPEGGGGNLPTLSYDASGANADHLGLALTLDGPTQQVVGPKDVDHPTISIHATDVPHHVSFTNPADGSFVVSTGDGLQIGSFDLSATNLDLPLMNIILGATNANGVNCVVHAPKIAGLDLYGAGSISLDLRTDLSIHASNLRDVLVNPGAAVHVSGHFGDLKINFANSTIAAHINNVALVASYDTGIDTIGVIGPFNVAPPWPLDPISFNGSSSVNLVLQAVSSTGPSTLIDFNSCPVGTCELKVTATPGLPSFDLLEAPNTIDLPSTVSALTTADIFVAPITTGPTPEFVGGLPLDFVRLLYALISNISSLGVSLCFTLTGSCA